ncbi:MAG: hypothetical protein OEM91_01835 [Hyphomicrobiales bacterium]|nr:hypothetical protein [Hyphomicrobiales bacterium]
MMRAMPKALKILFPGVLAAALLAPQAAHARCKTVTQTHNGTNFFYSDGAAGTAAYKIRLSVEQWQKKTGVKKVRIGKINTSCGKWFIKYGLPHQHCVAKARVCW